MRTLGTANSNGLEPIRMSFSVDKGDFQKAGEASSKVKNTLLQLGFPAEIIRRIAIATYEAEMNIVIHSLGGVIDVDILPDRVIITAADCGPGIPNLDLAMEEGYSTAPEHIREMGFGAGMGLPNMRNCSDEFHIESLLNVGTTVRLVITVKE